MSEIKLPETVEEYQRALRVAFEEGARFQHATFPRSHSPTIQTVFCQEILRTEARDRYPIRKKVPRAIYLSAAREPAVVHPCGPNPAMVKLPETRRYLSREDVDALSELLANPFEEVDE